MKKTLIIIAIVALIIISGISFLKENDNTETIKIGFIGSLTGVDPSYGASMKGGVEMAVSKINASGGINGKKLEVIYEDGKCIENQSAVSAAQKLINVDNVEVVIGGGCSNEVSSTASIFNEAEVVMLTSGASSPTISGLGDFIFRNMFSDKDSSRDLVKKVVKDGHKNMAIVSDNSEYSVGFKKYFVQYLSETEAKVISDQVVSSDGMLDFKTDILKIDKKAGALFINLSNPKSTGIFVKQARELGLNMPIYIAFHHNSPDFLENTQGYLKGATFISYPNYDGGIQKELLEQYIEKYGHEPVYTFNVLASYDATMIIADAMKKGNLKGKDIKKYLNDLSDYQGLIGVYSFDQNGDIQNLKYSFQQVVDGKFVNID